MASPDAIAAAVTQRHTEHERPNECRSSWRTEPARPQFDHVLARGTIRKRPRLRIGYLPQELETIAGKTALDAANLSIFGGTLDLSTLTTDAITCV